MDDLLAHFAAVRAPRGQEPCSCCDADGVHAGQPCTRCHSSGFVPEGSDEPYCPGREGDEPAPQRRRHWREPRTAARTDPWHGEGPWYHGTPEDLEPGAVIQPGDVVGKQHMGRGSDSTRTWVTNDAWKAASYGTNVYEVDPSVRPKSMYARHHEHYLPDGGTATVLRQVPYQEATELSPEYQRGARAMEKQIRQQRRQQREAGVGDYGIHHRPMEHGAPVHDLAGESPDADFGSTSYMATDYLTHRQYYTDSPTEGARDDAEAIAQMRRVQGKPDAPVHIYRATHHSAPHEMNPGDWVTLSKRYAAKHAWAESGSDDPETQYAVHHAVVPARHVRDAGSGGYREQGYWGPPTTCCGHEKTAVLPMPKPQYGPEPKYDFAPEDWPPEKRDAHNQTMFDKRTQWKAGIKRGLSLGHLTAPEAKAHGYYFGGHETDDRNEPKWAKLPHDLYHVTTDEPSVRRGGLKTRAELSQQTGGHGLGGGEDDTISFTTDRKMAHGILGALHEFHGVVNGKLTPKQMWDQAKAGHGADRPFHQDIARYYKSDWKDGDELPRALHNTIHEVQRDNTMGSSQEMIDKMRGPGWHPAHDDEGWMSGHKPPQKMHAWWEKEMDPDQRRDNAASFYKHFAVHRQMAGGAEDPMFFATDTKAFAAKDPRHFALLHVRPRPGAQGYPVSSMSEWRTGTGDAVDVHHAEHAGDLSKTGLCRQATQPYSMQHEGPDPGEGEGLHEIGSGKIWPKDFHERPWEYSLGADHESMDKVHGSRDWPSRKVWAYRALPSPHREVNTGDWVSTSRRYARQEGRTSTNTDDDYPVVKFQARAEHLRNEGNSLDEWSYTGPKVNRALVHFSGGKNHRGKGGRGKTDAMCYEHEPPEMFSQYEQANRERREKRKAERAARERTAVLPMPGMRNPHTGGDEWFHGTRAYPEELSEHGFSDPMEFDSGAFENPDAEPQGHWNSLLGTHFTADHDIAKEFALGEHSSGANDRGQDAFRGEARHVMHARLGLHNPKVYASEHDMDHEAYEHEHAAGNHPVSHVPQLGSDDPEDRYEAEEMWPGTHMLHQQYGARKIPAKAQLAGHPVRTNWLNSHPDRWGIADRFRRRLQAQGHDGIIYGNEYEHSKHGENANKSAIVFDPARIQVTQRHHAYADHLSPEEGEHQQARMPGAGQQQLFSPRAGAARRKPLQPDQEECWKCGVRDSKETFTKSGPYAPVMGLAMECTDKDACRQRREEGRRTAANYRGKFRCRDCGWDTNSAKPGVRTENYVVHNDVWHQAGMDKMGGNLCVGCLEKRLGRQLHSGDFPAVPVNDLSDADTEHAYTWRTDRLKDRIQRQAGLLAHFGATDWDEFHAQIPGEIHRGLYAPESHGVLAAPQSDEDVAHGLIAAHQEEHFPYQRDQRKLFGTHWTSDEGVARDFAQEHERNHFEDDQCPDHDEHPEATPVVFHARRPQRHEIEDDPRRLGWQNVDDYTDPEHEVPIRHGAPVHITGVSWLKHTGLGPIWHRHDLREPVRLRAEDRDSPSDPTQWNASLHTAAWQPTQRIFGPTYGLDRRLFTAGEELKPGVRQALLGRLQGVLEPVLGPAWDAVTRVYLAGSEASRWTSPELVGNGDLDVLIGVAYSYARQEAPALAGLTDVGIDKHLNAALQEHFNAPGWHPPFGPDDTYDLTGYCNNHALDIRAIKPYAAYDLTNGEWAVKPPDLPGWSAEQFPQGPALMQQARALIAEVRAILRLPEPFRTQEAGRIWDYIHEGRRQDFTEQGLGWQGTGNVLEKALDQASGKLVEKLKALKYGSAEHGPAALGHGMTTADLGSAHA